MVLSQTLGSAENVFYLNGLERRKSSIFNIPIQLKNPEGHDNFYDKYNGPIDTVIEFKDSTVAPKVKNEYLIFKSLNGDMNAKLRAQE